MSQVIYRGTLTLEKLKELALEHLSFTGKEKNVMHIWQEKDGNWSGTWHKNGKDIEVRDVGPETVVQRLLTRE